MDGPACHAGDEADRVNIPVSRGEALDRLSIALVKAENGLDSIEEIRVLRDIVRPRDGETEMLTALNRLLWRLEDDIRAAAATDDEPRTAIHARTICWLNELRAMAKKAVGEKRYAAAAVLRPGGVKDARAG